MRAFSLILLLVFVASCGGSKNAPGGDRNIKNKDLSLRERIVATASGYVGTDYKYGGTTDRGMDCSGLLYTSFAAHGVQLPRTSLAMSREARAIPKSKAQVGDLVFFRTNKSKRSVNHVGVISRIEQGRIYFLHSTSSRGVIESHSEHVYWSKAVDHYGSVL